MPLASAPRPAGSAWAPHLASPPRHVPFTVRVRVLFGGYAALAWIWLAVGSGVGLRIALDADLSSWVRFRGPVATVAGVSLACDRTAATEGGRKGRPGTAIYATRYRYDACGATWESVSYAKGRCVQPGQALVVEHVPGRPELSRVAGMRRATFGVAAGVLGGVAWAMGLVLVLASFGAGRRQLHLLAHGKIALGTLVAKEATSVRSSGRRLMRLRFAITTDAGVRHEVSVKTPEPEVLEDEPRERILYDPADPRRAVAWDLLPFKPRIEPGGGFAPAPGGGALAVLLPPAVAVVALAAVLVLAR